LPFETQARFEKRKIHMRTDMLDILSKTDEQRSFGVVVVASFYVLDCVSTESAVAPLSQSGGESKNTAHDQ